MIRHGDCLDVMATLEPKSVSAIVTDPPYDLTSGKKGGTGVASVNLASPYGRSRIGTGNGGGGFMGKAWDATGIAFRPETWALAFAAAKPGAHLLAFGGTRTVHRMTVAIEDAGWEIRDCLVWAYASGFPKSHNLSGEWDGWGTALKPAWEPIVMARKPLRGTVAANVLAHGTGALNIDGTRIAWAGPDDIAATESSMGGARNFRRVRAEGHVSNGPTEPDGGYVTPVGRWPANVILTDPIFDGGIEGVVGGGETSSGLVRAGTVIAPSGEAYGGRDYGRFHGYVKPADTYGDSGTYSRFFLIPSRPALPVDGDDYTRFLIIPKADRAEREPIAGSLPMSDVFRGNLPDNPKCRMCGRQRIGALGAEPCACEQPLWAANGDRQRQNVHPTVKPLDLMRHLVRLVTPPGGVVLDPFLGSGTTGIACEMEGFDWIGIEREAEYVAIAQARLEGVQKGMGLFA